MKTICFLGGYGGGPECQDRLVGPQRLYVELGIRLQKKFKIYFLHLGDRDEIASRGGIKEIIIRKGIWSLFKTLTALNRINPELVHGHGSLNMALVLAVIKKVTSRKTIITFTDFKKNWIDHYKILNWLDAVIVQTGYAQEKLIREGVHRRLIHKITYGVEDKFYQAKACAQIRGLSPKILLYYGDARYERGLHLLLRSLPLLSKDILVLLCIRKFEKGFSLKRIRSLAAENVRVMTIKEYPAAIEDIIKSSDVVVLPFIKNTLEPPLTLMEVSAVGKPLITADSGGNKEVIDEGSILIGQISAENLAAAVNSWFKSPLLPDHPKRYPWKLALDKISGIYEQQ